MSSRGLRTRAVRSPVGDGRRTGWLDLSSGASGDMLLGALVGAGVPLAVFADAVAPLGLPLWFRSESVRRAGLAATRVHVDVPESSTPRRWSDIRELLERLPAELRGDSIRVFLALAEAEAAVHGIGVEEVHFHEVGALDAIADVVGVCAGLRALELDRLVVSPIATGSGTVGTAHGRLPVPVPAVLELLRGAAAPTAASTSTSARGGSAAEGELCTPTGAALVTTLATDFGPMPSMTVEAVGSGAGARDPEGRPNVVRLVVGTGTTPAAGPPNEPVAGPDTGPEPEPAVVLEANVDDLDPRVWPEVIESLMAAGAADAWLTPIVMKKGRPATTLSVLCDAADLARLRAVVFRQTSTLGVRETGVQKRPLTRDVAHVDVDGQRIAVKRGYLPDGSLVTAQPEWEDVKAAALALGLSAREVLSRASAAAHGVQ